MRNASRCLLMGLALCAAVLAQTAPAPEIKDALGRNTPQSAIVHFLEAAHSRDYQKASRYLDLRRIPQKDQATAGADAARKLEDLLDDTPFEITSLSRDPEGDQTDGLPDTIDSLYTFHVDGQTLELQMERVERKAGLHVWLVSADSVALIPKAHQLVAETAFEKKLPQVLVTTEVFDTPVWRWIALLLMGVVVWVGARLATLAWVRAVGHFAGTGYFAGPIRLLLLGWGLHAALEIAEPSTLPRFFLGRALTLMLAAGFAWLGAAIIDVAAVHWHTQLDPRAQAIRYSVLPLGRQITKMALFLIALLEVFTSWGYNTSTILAGLGVGGLAVALAAQKTIENLFGGISVIGDRPVLVGDICRFGEHTGTVMHIGLRSTRIRTTDRAIISIPNSQFSTMALENLSGRDKMWFHPTLNLRRDTTAEQMSNVLRSIGEILERHPRVETGKVPVRFIGVGSYSLDVEVFAYVKTSDNDEFLALQQELLLQILQAVERAGTALAVPLQENFAVPRTNSAG